MCVCVCIYIYIVRGRRKGIPTGEGHLLKKSRKASWRSCGARGRRCLSCGRRSAQSLLDELRRAWPPLGPRLPFACTEPPGRAAARVAAAGAAAAFRVGRRSNTEPPGRAAARVAVVGAAAAFRVAGAVHRASWTSCGARGRRWGRGCFRVAGATYHSPLITHHLSHLTHHFSLTIFTAHSPLITCHSSFTTHHYTSHSPLITVSSHLITSQLITAPLLTPHSSQLHCSSQLITAPLLTLPLLITSHRSTSHHNSSPLITAPLIITGHHSFTSHTSLITSQLLITTSHHNLSHPNSSQLHFSHHFSHLTYHITTHHSSTSHTSLLTHSLITAPLLTPSFTHPLWHTIFYTPSFTHTQLCHPPSLTHHLSHTIFVTHNLSHTTLSHTIFHTPSFTHSFVTHHLSHTIFHTHHLSHATLSHTIFPPPPLFFLPSPPPLQHFWLIIGRSWLVGISGPFIASFETRTRTVIRGQMPGIRGRRQHMGWFDPDNDRSRELRFLIFSLQLSAGCAVAWFLWNAHHIAQNKDRIHGFSKAPILLWHTVGSFFPSFFDGKESQLSKDETFPFHIYARNSAQESERGTWLQARLQIIFSAPANQGLGRYKRERDIYMVPSSVSPPPPGGGGWQGLVHIYSYKYTVSTNMMNLIQKDQKILKVLRVSRTREGI